MKLITMILIALFYIGCGQASGDVDGGTVDGNTTDSFETMDPEALEAVVQENLQENTMMVDVSEISNPSVTVSFKSGTSSRFTCEHENAVATKKAAVEKAGGRRAWNKLKDADKAVFDCLCEIRVNGNIVSYAQNDRKWCAKKEAEFASGRAITKNEGATITNVHVGRTCAVSGSSESDTIAATTYVCE